MSHTTVASLGAHEKGIRARLGGFLEDRVAERLWDRDASLWAKDDAARRVVENRLGWLDAPASAARERDLYESLARSAREAGIRHVMLLGMGGSSLCPEVLRRTFPPAPGFPSLAVLDSTHPAAVLLAGRDAPLAETLFLVSTKSGTTLETRSLFHYFWQLEEAAGHRAPGPAFVAVTDPGTPLEAEARTRGFRAILPGPPTVGGRYSALTPFGLAPAALLGIDLAKLVARAESMAERCRLPGENNPGLFLGAALCELGLTGRDKVTVIVDPPLASFGLWREQLLAESLGKEGKGLIPVPESALGPPSSYGDDRVFVHLGAGTGSPEAERALTALEAAGHPVLRLPLEDAYDVAGEFFRWEVATAVIAHGLGVNAFDEPNVAESKKNTENVLDALAKTGSFASETPWAKADGLELYGPPGAPPPGARTGGERELVRLWETWLAARPVGSYLSLQAYLPTLAPIADLLEATKLALRDRTRLAVTAGFGPRFLHSTGQLHKGGPPKGAFVQITAGSRASLPIPGAPFTFEALIRAQALGDARSLGGRMLPFLRLHFDDGGDLGVVRTWLDRLTRAAASGRSA
jgi:glucose-6-phosphate isomerase